MKNAIETNDTLTKGIVITPEQLLEHWQGHRRITRRVIEAFPEDQFFTYSIGGMRPFSALIMEILGMAVPGVQGLMTGKWASAEEANALFSKRPPATRAEVLRIWDDVTEEINKLWSQIPPHRFQEVDVAFGQYEAPMHFTIFYWIDNEIHHRGQGYVYLRSLGIEPPAFWDRN